MCRAGFCRHFFPETHRQAVHGPQNRGTRALEGAGRPPGCGVVHAPVQARDLRLALVYTEREYVGWMQTPHAQLTITHDQAYKLK